MIHQLPLLLALSIAPAATPAFDPPSAVTTGATLEQPARTSDSYERSGSLTGQSGSPSLGGLPTFGASSSGNVTMVNRGRMDVGGGQMVYWYTILVGSGITGTGFDEQFIVFSPNVPNGVVAPMVVAFHGFGNTQKQIPLQTTLINECAKRGWYLMAPLSANQMHFMSDPGQKNTEVAMDWMKAKFSIDLSRIYGVGFSMGGGMALNFAARHLDPSRWTFAAIVNHTGAVDLIDTYENDPASNFVFDFWYGQGVPGTASYDLMRRASLMEWDPVAQQAKPDSDLVRNLEHVPLMLIRGANDPLANVVTQHDRLDQHLQSLGRVPVPGTSYSYEIIPSDVHSWSTLDEAAACDWLSQWSLDLPTQQRTIAAADGYYYSFLVMQADGTLLTPFTWQVDTFTNEFRLSETANMTQIVLLTDKAGLDTTQPLDVVMATADGNVNKVVVNGYSVQPSAVLRDGQVLPTSLWSYAPSTGLVTLTEWDGAGVHTYSIQP